MILIKNETSNKLNVVYNGPKSVIEDLDPNVKVEKDRNIITVHNILDFAGIWYFKFTCTLSLVVSYEI